MDVKFVIILNWNFGSKNLN